MAIVAMKRLELYGLQRERKALLELLQRRGMVEIHSPQRKEPLFSQADTSQAQLEWEQNASLLEDAAALLDRYSPPKKGALSFLQGRPVISSQQYEAAAREVPAQEAAEPLTRASAHA